MSGTLISRTSVTEGLCLPGFGSVGVCSWTPTQDHPCQHWHPLHPSGRRGRQPPPTPAATSAAAPPPYPSPTLPPFSRWPPRSGTSRARAPPPPAAPARPGSPNAVGAAVVVVAAAVALSDGDGDQRPKDDARCTPASLLRSPRFPFWGRGESPSRLSSPPRPRPLAHRLLDIQKDPASSACTPRPYANITPPPPLLPPPRHAHWPVPGRAST